MDFSVWADLLGLCTTYAGTKFYHYNTMTKKYTIKWHKQHKPNCSNNADKWKYEKSTTASQKKTTCAFVS